MQSTGVFPRPDVKPEHFEALCLHRSAVDIFWLVPHATNQHMTPVASTDVAEKIIDSLGAQIDLLFTLSVAVCGGIIALVFQIAMHNRSGKDAGAIQIRSSWALVVAMLFEGVSFLCGYFARGAITRNIPSICRLDFGTTATFEPSPDFPGYNTLAYLIACQFYAFAVGALLLFFLTFRNRRLI